MAPSLPQCLSRAQKGQVRQIELGKGRLIGDEELADSTILVVVTGLIMVSGGLPGSERRTVGFYFPGEVIAIGAQRHGLRLELKALQPASLQGLNDEVWTRSPKLGAALLERMCHQLAMEQRARLAATSRHIDTRVAAFVLDLVERSGAGRAATPAVKLPMRRCDIADYLGIRVETLSRLLTTWKTAGVIRLPMPREVVLLDRTYLEALVSEPSAN